MIKIAICDDSPCDASYLEKLCNEWDMLYEIKTQVFTNAELFLDSHQKDPYDIVFLDIEMPNQSGIELGMQLKKINRQTIIIFSTSYPQYAIEGYNCEAFQYLLKPLSKEKLQTTLRRAIRKIAIFHQYHCVKTRNTVQRIPISEILFIEYCRKHIIYHTKNNLIETTGRFSDVINELQKHGFYQIHQGYIVNLAKIKSIQGYSVILEDNTSVLVSVRKKTSFLLAYAKYLEDLL